MRETCPKPLHLTAFRTKVENRNLLHLGLVIIFGSFATTLPQPQGLGRLPLQFLLKNEVSVTREQMAAFFFWGSLAWYLKYGLLFSGQVDTLNSSFESIIWYHAF